jgi:hypothetical protein
MLTRVVVVFYVSSIVNIKASGMNRMALAARTNITI